MISLRMLSLVSLIALVPSLAIAQDKGSHPHPTRPVVKGRSAPVRQDAQHKEADRVADKAKRTADKAADKSAREADKTADKSALNADKSADKSARAGEKAERTELKLAHDTKHLTKGIQLTLAEKKQVKAIEKKYDEQYRDLRKKERAADKSAEKSGTAESDAAFLSQVSQLKTQERAEIRAVLSTQQQSGFDHNVSTLSSRK